MFELLSGPVKAVKHYILVGSVEVNRFCITTSSPMSQPLSSSWFILCPSSYATPFLTMRSVSLFVCDFFPHFFSIFPLPPLSLSPFFSLSVTFTLSQNYDDIDLENEPWYKFFSELEFGRPVSQGRSCFFFNHNPVIGIHPLSPPHP